MCNMRDFNLALVSGTGIRARELTERTFAGTNARHNVTFQNNLSMGRNIQMFSSIGFSDLGRNAVLQRADKFVFVLVVVDRSTGHKANKRSIAKSNRYRQRLIDFFGFCELDSNIMERQCLNADAVDIFDLDAVNTYILFIQIIGFSRITGNNSCFDSSQPLPVDGISRVPLCRTGDIIQREDGTYWHISKVLEDWSAHAGWANFEITQLVTPPVLQTRPAPEPEPDPEEPDEGEGK